MKKIYIVKDFSKYYASEDLGISAIFSNEENITSLKKSLSQKINFQILK